MGAYRKEAKKKRKKKLPCPLDIKDTAISKEQQGT